MNTGRLDPVYERSPSDSRSPDVHALPQRRLRGWNHPSDATSGTRNRFDWMLDAASATDSTAPRRRSSTRPTRARARF